MPAPTPSNEAAYSELLSLCGFELGYGRGDDFDEEAWDAYQTRSIKDVVKQALRRVNEAHDWSWKRPMASFTLAAGSSTIGLGDDFGGQEGSIILSTGDGASAWELPWQNDELVRQAIARQPDATGLPCMASLAWIREVTINHGQRAVIRFWPTADQEYTAEFPMYFIPDALEANLPYAYGGADLAQVRTDAVLMQAEFQLSGMMGTRAAMYEKTLARAIEADRHKKPSLLGTMTNSERAYLLERSHYRQPGTGVTVNGYLSGVP